MNPEHISNQDDLQLEETAAEAEHQAAAEEDEDDREEEYDESGDEDENEEDSESEVEEGDDSTKDSIPIAESHGPSAAVPDDGGAASSASRSIAIPVLIHPSSPPPISASPAGDPGLASSVSAPPGPSSKPAASSAKPRSKKPRSPSPSPPPAPPAPPLTTIRLEIKLGGPNKYEIDVSKLAKDSGQRPPTPPPRITVTKQPVSESEPDTDGGKKKKRRKNPTSEYYDVNDPFIDDSELALDERTYFAQTKQQGFYVSSGEVALLKDKTPKKPKSKKMISLSAAINASNGSAVKASAVKAPAVKSEGTKEEETVGADDSGAKYGDEEGDERVGQKRKRYITIVENGKKRKVVDQSSFHPELQASIERLKEYIKAENWSQKGKFPATLKPQLANLALQAIRLDEYDEHFFNLMPVLFPYNKFTMTKLIKRTVFADHMKLLHDRQEELLRELKALTTEGFQKAEEEWTRTVLAWDRRQEKAKNDQPDSAAPTRHPTEEMEVDSISTGVGQHGDGESKDGAGKESKEAQPPQKRYRLTEPMKNVVWQLVLLSNECCRLENEKNNLEGSVIQVSEQGSRKNLYQKIVAQFPDGWMNSGNVSREVSVMKKKYEKETMEGED
ncbi:hypothetical protein AGABI1DRAFT_78898 [Agaricus bisporus var. burnettii JB137-S8]|uniref:Ubinuclein middle domain-containing protein n=1 Tax=Agaricus bisporus var. burnettii (strain JB137-S8 / ATCC MYA-4627 / FGSC 10392) TaxID=597362 RepID=K5VNZ5_AGABU|nr:uncharacterized protein AGABI1DRAFT_78898 [Agaricus bisporus var. burnettii JB137-S8]EKM76174.1 hypothetical protein AGABI1DRAFT_78898 [Agaricus bisporus var. burnettii JB137-S8]